MYFRCSGAIAAAAAVLLLHGAKVYTSPAAPPLSSGDVLVHGPTIVAVGPSGTLNVPGTAKVIDVSGLVIVSAFQNSHVHFIEPVWAGAARTPASELAAALERMLTRYGFTTVVDTGSIPEDTLALRARIESGEIAGPRIFTAGTPLYPPNGIPVYLKDLPPAILNRMPQPATPEAAAAVVRANLASGVDVTKLFAGSVMDGFIKPMPVNVARAAVDEAHDAGKLVFAHPSNTEGARVAIDAGVDVLAHTNSDGWDTSLVDQFVAHRMALVPTLKLWPYEAAKGHLGPAETEAFVGSAIEQLRVFAQKGGQVLFGTDVGYMTDYDPTDEYVLMARAGLSPMQILAALTTNPAARFNESDRRGRIEPGLAADLVVLEADPATDVHNFAKVRYTIRGGSIIFGAMRDTEGSDPSVSLGR